MLPILSTVIAVVAALTLFQTATLLIGGHIFKDPLAPFYATFPEWWQRMLIVIIPLSGIGNLLAVYAFQNPIIAGVAFLVVGLWSPLIIAAVIDRTTYGLAEFALVGAISILGIVLGARLV